MTDIAKLATDVAAYASSMMSANARYDSLQDQLWGEESVDGMRKILDELRSVLADVSAVEGMEVTFYAAMQDARTVLDAIEEALDNTEAISPSVVESLMAETLASIDAAVIASAGAPETLSARLQRRRREARAAEGEDIEDDAADGTEDDTEAEADAVEDADNADEDAGGVFDPMAFQTVEAVDAEIARYDAEIAQINADLAGYEEAKRQLMERRDQIESGADAAIDEANAEAA